MSGPRTPPPTAREGRGLAVRASVASGLALAFLAAALGCQAIVSSTLPPFSCVEDKLGTCPPGQFCSGGACVKGSPVDSAIPPLPEEDAEIPDSAPPVDVMPDTRDAGPAAVGQPCRINNDCASKLCADGTLLGSDVVSATSGAVCTQTCCKSEECPRGTVCFTAGKGGNYCVTAGAIGNRVSGGGTQTGGGTCDAGSDCRSGLCLTGRCTDTCCNNGDCVGAPGVTNCTLKRLQAKYDSFVCGGVLATLRDDGQGCTADSSCKSGKCVNLICVTRCCNNAQCGSTNICTWNFASSDPTAGLIQQCFPSRGRSKAGAVCTKDTDCDNDFCDPDTQKCVDLCCVDRDCQANEKCAPANGANRLLRCVPR